MTEPPSAIAVDTDEIVRRSHEAFVVMDARGRVLRWNHAAERIFGFSAQEAIGSRLSDLIIPVQYRELHERGLRRFMETGDGPVLGSTIEIEGIDRDGRLVPVELTINPLRVADESIFYAFLNDVTHRRRTERFLRAEARVAWLCAEHTGAVDSTAIAAAIGEEMAFQLGLVWLPDSRNRLVLSGSWATDEVARAFVIDSETFSFEPGIGLPGATWQQGQVRWNTDVSNDPAYVRRSNALKLGFRSGLFLPIGRDERCRGVLEFLTHEWRTATDDLIERFARLGARLGRHV